MIWLNGKQYKTHFNSSKNRPANSVLQASAIIENAYRDFATEAGKALATEPLEVSSNALEE